MSDRTKIECIDCGYRPTFDEIDEYGSECPECGGHGGNPDSEES